MARITVNDAFYINKNGKTTNILDMCENKYNYSNKVGGFTDTDANGIAGVLPTGYSFVQNVGLSYENPIDNFFVNGIAQQFTPKYAINGNSTTYRYVSNKLTTIKSYFNGNTAVPSYKIVEVRNGTEYVLKTNARSYVIAFCGGGASGVDCKTHAAGGANGGAGSGAATIAIRIIPTHTKTNGNDDVTSISIGSGGKISSALGKYAPYATGHTGKNGSATTIKIGDYTISARGGVQSGGQAGSTGPWPAINDTDVKGAALDTWYNGSGCKFEIVGAAKGGNGSKGGGNAGDGGSASIDISLNGTLNDSKNTYSANGGDGWDGGWSAAPGGGGASAFGSGSGCPMVDGLTFHYTSVGYGGGGVSGVLVHFPALIVPGTAFHAGNGGDGLMLIKC